MKLQDIHKLQLPNWTKFSELSAMQNLLAYGSHPDFISFALGLPAVELFPTEIYKKVAGEIIDKEPLAFQYVPPIKELKTRIVYLMKHRGVICNEKQIFLTSGAQQGISLLVRLLLEKNKEIILEELSYPGLLQTVIPFSPKILTVSTHLKTGVEVEEIENILKKGHKPAFMYIVTDGSNPHASSLSESKRVYLAELANKYGCPIIEDDPYGFLNYENKLPPMKFYGGDWVFYIGSFSKIFAPSLRVGWIIVPDFLISKLSILKESSDVNITTFSQRMVNALLQEDFFHSHIELLCREYKKRRDCLIESLNKYFPSDVLFHTPESGIFVWAELPNKVDTIKLLENSLHKAAVAFVPSQAFAANKKIRVTHSMRLNFSHSPTEKIERGIKKLSLILKEELAS